MDTSTLPAENIKAQIEVTVVSLDFIEKHREDYDQLAGAEDEYSYMTLYRLCSHSRQLPRIVAVRTTNK